jgi:hypothetical protein
MMSVVLSRVLVIVVQNVIILNVVILSVVAPTGEMVIKGRVLALKDMFGSVYPLSSNHKQLIKVTNFSNLSKIASFPFKLNSTESAGACAAVIFDHF